MIMVVVQMGNLRPVRTMMSAFIQSVSLVTEVAMVTIRAEEIMAVAVAGAWAPGS